MKVGDVFTRLTVQALIPGGNSALVKCQCGMTRSVSRGNLRAGRTKSCGCLKAETDFSENLPRYAPGEAHPNWKGGRRIDVNGYVVLRERGVDQYEHRLVMSAWIGRPLHSGEVVHHINHNRADNRIANLVLFPSHRAHALFHAKRG